MKKILSQLTLCALITLCFISGSPVTAQLGETKRATTGELIAEFRTLFPISPIETKKVVDALLINYLRLELKEAETSPGEVLKNGTTKDGMLVDYYASQYPDEFRSITVSIGPTHVLELEDFRGRLIKATFVWLEQKNKQKAHSLKLFYDAEAQKQAQNAWKQYCQRLSATFPDLPPLRLSDKHRVSFTGLYEGLNGNAFAEACGVAGIAPDSRASMVRLLHANQLTAIRYVLRSKNVASQLYAAESLLLLKQNGRKLAETDKERIDKLRLSTEQILVCVGGEYEKLSAQASFSYFTNQTLEDYLSDWRRLGYLR